MSINSTSNFSRREDVIKTHVLIVIKLVKIIDSGKVYVNCHQMFHHFKMPFPDRDHSLKLNTKNYGKFCLALNSAKHTVSGVLLLHCMTLDNCHFVIMENGVTDANVDEMLKLGSEILDDVDKIMIKMGYDLSDKISNGLWNAFGC